MQTFVTSLIFVRDKKAFYGAGSVVGVTNEPLAWDIAENLARAELARNFETYTAYLMRDYAAARQAGDFTKTTEEQNVQRAIKTVSAVTLSGARPIDRQSYVPHPATRS